MRSVRDPQKGETNTGSDDQEKERLLGGLRCLGLEPDADTRFDFRGDRIMVHLDGRRIAWVPLTPTATVNLRTENRVLDLIGVRCRFELPKVLHEAPDGSLIRSMVPGQVDPYGFAARLKADPTLIDSAAAMLALILGEQHTRIGEADVAGWLQTAPTWPLLRIEVENRLPHVTDDRDLLRRIGQLLDAYHDPGTREEDLALIHGDFGLHNVAFGAGTGRINGVFDYGSAAWADRHFDFRYLVFSAVPDALLDATIAAYGKMTGVAIDRHRVLVCNAAAAVSHLADRAGRGPEEVVASRTLAGDLGWTEWALRRAGF